MSYSWNRSAAAFSKPTRYEGSLEELYRRPYFLNPTWRIIFQEAMRGNHILFQGLISVSESIPDHSEDRLTVSRERQRLNQDHSVLIDAACSIFQSSDLAHMRSILAKLNLLDRQRLFYIYKNQICRWQKRNQSQLH